MAEQRHSDDGIHGQSGKALKRRGLITGAAALAAGLLAKQTANPVAAAASMQFANTTTMVSNVALGETELLANLTTTTIALHVDASSSADTFDAVGVLGVGSHNAPGLIGLMDGVPFPGPLQNSAIYGQSASGFTGVFGQSAGVGAGVEGSSNGSPGLFGSYGVYGKSDVGVGVAGIGLGSATGVYGQSIGGNGVYGFASAAGATQVVAGVFGDSTTTYGIIGRTTAVGYSGLTAITGTAGVAALAATATVNTAYAAYFQGNTVVQGNFAVVGGAKSAAVKDASGQHRLVYCMESPEAWFEDFGTGMLVGGKATVTLDPIFSQIAHTDVYYVFLTPRGDFHAHVTQQTASGFEVQQTTGTGKAGASGAFSYRVVAKRKDIAGERLAKFDLPKINIPAESKLIKSVPPKKA